MADKFTIEELVGLDTNLEDLKFTVKDLVEEFRELNRNLNVLHEDLAQLNEIIRYLIKVQMVRVG